MVGAEQHAAAGQRILRSVYKREAALRLECSLTLEIVQVSIKTNFAQDCHNLHPAERGEFAIEKRCTTCDLIWIGFVLRRRAAHSGRDVGVIEAQAIAAVSRRGLRREAGLVQHAIEKMSGAVARKRPSGAVRSMCSG